MNKTDKLIDLKLPLSYAMISYLVLNSKKNGMDLSTDDQKAIDTLETELRLALKDQAEQEYLEMREEGVNELSKDSSIQNKYREIINTK